MKNEQPMEGWYTDPFGRHEARWMSSGTPTPLVRDGRKESQDAVQPGESWKVTPQLLGDDGGSPSDLLRADDAELEDVSDAPRRSVERAWDVEGEAMP